MHLRQTAALWTGRLTACLPEKVNQSLWRVLRLAKPQPIYRLEGIHRGGGQGSMILAGNGPIFSYAPGLYFAGEPKHELLARVPLWRFRAQLRRLRDTADCAVVRVDSAVAHTLFGRDYLHVPEWVRSSMLVPPVSEKLGQHSGSLRQDLRLVRKYQYKAIESREEAELRYFYDTMFRPHTVGRHRSTTYLKTYAEVKSLWKNGVLIWAEERGERVGGLVVSRRGDALLLVALGTRQGDESLLRRGVLSALYQFAIEYAQRNHFKHIDFGATRPSLNDGLLRYKRKWGAVLDARAANPSLLLSYWKITTPGVSAMLKESPLIFRQAGGLSAIGSAEAPAPAAEACRGLDRYYAARPGKRMQEEFFRPAILSESVAVPVSDCAPLGT